jgi:hypothetical protein
MTKKEEWKMSMLDYPEKTCPMCGGDLWWWSSIEAGYQGAPEWVCGACKPPPTEKARLVMRIMRANVVLTKARAEIQEIEDKEERVAQFKLWGESINKIQEIGRGLKNISTDCLYIEKSKKMKPCLAPFIEKGFIECFTCPNGYWWMQEIFDREKLPDAPRTIIKPEPKPGPKEDLKNFMTGMFEEKS